MDLEESSSFKDKLIEVVRNRPIVWNTKLASFRDIKLKEENWKEIANELGSTVEHCQYIYKKLRDTFVRKRASVYENPEILKRNKWKYFEPLMFLDEFCKGRKKESIRLHTVIESLASPPSASNLFVARNELKRNLISEVKVCENLWNTNLLSYHDHELKKQSWKQIAQKLNTTGKECRTTFKVMRDAYFQIYSERDNPKWEYYDSLRFLDAIRLNSSTAQKTVHKVVVDSCDSLSSDAETSSDHDKECPTSSSSFAPKITGTSTVDLSSFRSSPSPFRSSSFLKRSRHVEPSKPIPSVPTINYSQIILNDELDIFGTSVVLKLRRMKESVRDDVIFKIETALHQGLQYSQQSTSIKDEKVDQV